MYCSYNNAMRVYIVYTMAAIMVLMIYIGTELDIISLTIDNIRDNRLKGLEMVTSPHWLCTGELRRCYHTFQKCEKDFSEV